MTELAAFSLRPTAVALPDSDLQLRKHLAGGDAQLGAGLDDAQAGDLQRQVLLVGELDQAIEGRIVERLPPRLSAAVWVARRGIAHIPASRRSPWSAAA